MWQKRGSICTLFKKVRVPHPSDIWLEDPEFPAGDDDEQGLQMVISEQFVAHQVKQVIERRENSQKQERTFDNRHE